MMKLALIKEGTTIKTTTSRYHSSLVKTTPHIKTRRKVPNFAARWCSIRKHLIQSKASNQGKQCKIQQQNENTPHAYSQIKKNLDQLSQSHYYSHFYLRTIQTHANYAIRAAKRTEDALGNFMKLSSLSDEST